LHVFVARFISPALGALSDVVDFIYFIFGVKEAVDVMDGY